MQSKGKKIYDYPCSIYRDVLKSITKNIYFYYTEMEIKKAKSADLESKKLTNFLLGLIVVLASLFVAFEYTDSGEEEENLSDEEIEEATHELDLAPLSKQEKRFALMPKAQPVVKPTKLKIVNNDAEIAPIGEVNSSASGNGYADAKVIGGEASDIIPTQAIDPNILGKDDVKELRVVEELPQFPGGPVEMMKWLTKNLKYPTDAQRRKKQGRVVAQFIIEKDGSISNLKLTTKVDASLDREAIRVLKLMPKWKAGVQNDKPCRTRVCIPIVFQL